MCVLLHVPVWRLEAIHLIPHDDNFKMTDSFLGTVCELAGQK